MVLASVVEVPLIWELVDVFNFFIVVPNIVAILWLSPQVAQEVKKMRSQKS